MKKIVSILVIFGILFFDISNAIAADTTEDLPGKEAVIKCIEAAQKKDESAMGRITNPINPKLNLICEPGSIQETVYQAVLDVRFAKVDKDIENYLKGLDGNTNIIKANKELSDRFSEIGEQNQFYYAYQKACNQILTDAVKLLGTVTTGGGTKDIIPPEEYNNKCLAIAQKKLNAYKNAGVVILARETAKSQENSWKSFFSAIRDKYEKLLMKFLNYISELGKISEKWNVSTPKAQTSP